MVDIHFKTEKLPQRCEICHQSDCFDPYLIYCTRCANIETQKNNKPLFNNSGLFDSKITEEKKLISKDIRLNEIDVYVIISILIGVIFQVIDVTFLMDKHWIYHPTFYSDGKYYYIIPTSFYHMIS